MKTNGNFDISSSTNTPTVNTIADSSYNKSTNSETMDAKMQQQEITQLHNNSSKIMTAEPEIKPLTDITVNLEDIKPG